MHGSCEEAKNELGQRGLLGSCECRRLDLADFTSVRQFAADTKQSLRREKRDITILINNAGPDLHSMFTLLVAFLSKEEFVNCICSTTILLPVHIASVYNCKEILT